MSTKCRDPIFLQVISDLNQKSDEVLLRRMKRFESFALRCISDGAWTTAQIAMERSGAARAELLRRYPG